MWKRGVGGFKGLGGQWNVRVRNVQYYRLGLSCLEDAEVGKASWIQMTLKEGFKRRKPVQHGV